LSAAKQAIRAAEVAEQQARELDNQVRQLRAAVAGQPAPGVGSNVQGVSVLLERSRLVREVRNSAEF
jgi:hypothetical protein